jgi:intracellular multiplication protein IcmK
MKQGWIGMSRTAGLENVFPPVSRGARAALRCTAAILLLSVIAAPAAAQSGLPPAAPQAVPQADPQADLRAGGRMATGARVVEGVNQVQDPRDQDLLTDGSAGRDRVDGFNQSVSKALPMTPEMIQRLRQIYDGTQDAIHFRAPVAPVVDADIVSLEPGEAPPTLSVTPGVASVLAFFDASGQAWPISGYVVGNDENFQVLRLGEEQQNFITVTPLVPGGWTNLVVSLEGQETPVVMTISVERDRVHYRRDIQVMALGPNAAVSPATNTSGPRPGDSGMLSYLAATDFPKDARPVDVEGVNARAWLEGDRLYVRSRLALISPVWIDSMAGPAGIRVYRLKRTPVLLFSENGRIVKARVSLP